MKATIVIPNINGKGWLKDSIESVYAQTEQDFELIVVDNGSTDESLEQARSYCSRPNFQLIENGSNTGFSHAVNQGIARAKSEFVVLFNNDAFAEPQWLAELIRVAESDEKIFAVQSLMIRHFNRELADDAGDYVTWMGFACKTGDVMILNLLSLSISDSIFLFLYLSSYYMLRTAYSRYTLSDVRQRRPSMRH